jgi:Zn-dependent protease
VDAQVVIFNVVTTIIPLILAIAVHEWAHVAMARFLGDRTGEEQGRLTLNPLAHIDPIWTVALPTFFVVMQTAASAAGGMAVPFFGAGKPAPYNPVRLDRKFGGKRISMRMGELLVAAAGPASNVVLAVLFTAVASLLYHFAGQGFGDPRSLTLLVFKFVVLNVGLAIFNLIPIPPLDGSKVLMSLLPRGAAASYERIATQLSWILLLVLFMGGASYVMRPIQHAVISLLLAVFF